MSLQIKNVFNLLNIPISLIKQRSLKLSELNNGSFANQEKKKWALAYSFNSIKGIEHLTFHCLN